MGAAVTSVAGTSYGLLATSLDNFVYLLSFMRGDRIWKRRLAGRLDAPPLALADSVLLTTLSGDAGIVLNLRDGKQINSLPLGEDSYMAAAPIVSNGILFITTRHGLLAFALPIGVPLTTLKQAHS